MHNPYHYARTGTADNTPSRIDMTECANDRFAFELNQFNDNAFNQCELDPIDSIEFSISIDPY